MNPGLVVKLRPSGPWRIGPDSGARNRVDVVYHSDSLYSAITSAMSRMGRLEEWLDATARSTTPAVCFGSCFPFVEQTGFIVPPRTVWPPAAPSLMAGRVRWKSARFVPLTMVQAILAGEPLDENRWTVDGESGCLLPAGCPGPFRTSVRWSAAVDRLSGASERHSTACIEFRPGAGLWTIAGFADDAARDRWREPVKAAFRLLADSGFGGERSRGWGRSEAPEFITGELPEMILGGLNGAQGPQDGSQGPGSRGQGPGAEGRIVEPPADLKERQTGEADLNRGQGSGAGGQIEEPPAGLEEPQTGEAKAPDAFEIAPLIASDTPDKLGEPEPEPIKEPEAETELEPALESEPTPSAAPLAPGPWPPGPALGPPPPEPAAEAHGGPAAASQPQVPISGPLTPGYWLLSLFTPAPSDTIDWARGSYTVLARGGRVESPAGSGELKKQIRMVAEGSVLIAEKAPRGTAADVAPEGFAHPVFRAGFALAIPLPEVH